MASNAEQLRAGQPGAGGRLALPRNLGRNECVQACVQELTRRPDFPAFSRSIQEVMAAADDQNGSARQITEVVRRDFGLSLKVLRTVNSFYYNRSGREIRSLGHAVAMLGAEAVRDLAGSMILVDHFRKKSPGVRELMMLSVVTANHARTAAERVHYRRLEEAYLCGMFRNLGELLIACYYPGTYAEILGAVSELMLTGRQAAFRVLRFHYEELGQAMTRHWQMPESVAECMRERTLRTSGSLSETGQMLTLVSFSHQLTEVVYRKEANAAAGALARLLDAYGPILQVRPEDVQRIVERALEESKASMEWLHLSVDDLRLRRQAALVLSALAEPAAGETEADEVELRRLQEELSARVAAPGDVDVNDVLRAAVDALHTAGGFRRALFGLVNAEAQEVSGRLGAGEGVDDAVSAFRFPLTARSGAIALAMLRRQDVFVNPEREGRFADSDLARRLNAASFGLFPVVVDDKVIGCLYFDDQRPRDLGESARQSIAGLREAICASIRRSRERLRQAL
ncbi:MAG: HDOD domain-containing protein [Bryobacteraceae bacterium]|nr:HDOD domain-containing protein [Bryobacteraceae bacterium]